MKALFRKYPLYKWFLAGCDFVVLNVAFAVALRLRFRPYIDVIDLQALTVAEEVIAFAAYSVIWLLVFQWFDLYKRQIIFTGPEQVVAILRGQWMGLIGVVLIQFFLHPFNVTLESRLMFIYFVLLSSVGLIVYRLWLVRRFFRSSFYRRYVRERALILGSGEGARALAGNLFASDEFHTELVGFLSDDAPVGTLVFRERPVLGDFDDIEDIIRKHCVNSVYLAENIQPVEKLLAIMERVSSQDVQVQLDIQRFAVVHDKVSIERASGYPLVRMTSGHSHLLFRITRGSLTSLGPSSVSSYCRRCSATSLTRSSGRPRDRSSSLRPEWARTASISSSTSSGP